VIGELQGVRWCCLRCRRKGVGSLFVQSAVLSSAVDTTDVVNAVVASLM
jgi:hypothetical protein